MSNANNAASTAAASAAGTEPAGNPIDHFEASMKELEDIVARMERGDLALEETLTLFERGTRLTRSCRASLETAELRVRKLSGDEAPVAGSAAE